MDITSNKSPQATELDALVIGAGFAGLYQLLCLRDCLGLSVKALEAGGGVAARRPAILGGVPGYDDQKDANDTAADSIKRKIRSIVKDRPTAAILSDIDHPYAAKRPPIDTESVYDHRSGQPVRAMQHAGGDPAARGLDRRLYRTCA